MTFAEFNLDPKLQVGITKAGYTTATPIQAAALPIALAGHDLIGTAQTGTGKTAAFVLPILQKLLTGPRKQARALIITPTRELAEQIHDNIRMLASGTDLRCATIYGGVSQGNQVRALREGVEILVVCPGRLLDHIEQGNTRLGKIEILVLDEADRMLDMGFLPPIRRILKQLPPQRQTMLFSATFPPEIEQLAASTTRQPKRLSVDRERPAHTVTHALYPVAQRLKLALLTALLKDTVTESVLIFTRTKHRAQRVAQQLAKDGHTVAALHSNRTQSQRQAALKGFKDGRYQVLVATDIAARGLDVESISHVINFDMPDTVDAYIHRIGRTGRAERTGDAFTLVTGEDNSMIRTLERTMGQSLVRQTLPDFDYNQATPEGHGGGSAGQAPHGAQSRRPVQVARRPAPVAGSRGGGSRSSDSAVSKRFGAGAFRRGGR